SGTAWAARPRDRTDMSGDTSSGVVVRRSGQGWLVGDEEAADLTSAMVLADLLAADLGSPAPPPAGPPRSGPVSEGDEADRLAVPAEALRQRPGSRVMLV